MGRFILHARWAVAALVALAFFPAAADASSADVAALQVALRALHLYHGGIDGIPGPGTKRAVRAFQHRHKLAVDGVAGAHTRRALGRRGRPPLGSRTMVTGDRGWDVAALQFLLAHAAGFPLGHDRRRLRARTRPRRASRFSARAGSPPTAVPGRRRCARCTRGARRPSTLGARCAQRPAPRRVRCASCVRSTRRWATASAIPAAAATTASTSPAPPGRAIGAAGVGIVLLRGLEHRRLRQPRDRAAPARLPDLVRAPLRASRCSPGRAVAGGTVIGYVGATGVRDRAPPALRGAPERRADQPGATLPLALVARQARGGAVRGRAGLQRRGPLLLARSVIPNP